MRIGSLFSGIGGLERGLERAGVGHTVWQAESDSFCREVLAKHWPDVRRFDDVRQVSAQTAPAVDVLCGGFPCQDISLAGKGKGLEGERSGLWWEFDRIIRDLRPKYVVVENVPALRSRGLAGVLGSLAESGYDAKWDCIPAQAVGAPHRRDRLFLVAWRVPDAERHPVWEQPERGQGAAQAGDEGHAEPVHLGEELADDNGRGWPPRPNDLLSWRSVQADAQPAICGITHGLPRRVDRLRALGNAVVPQVAQLVGGWIQELEAS